MYPSDGPVPPSPRDGVPAHAPPERPSRAPLLAATGAVAALVVVAVVLVIGQVGGGDGDGGGGDDPDAASAADGPPGPPATQSNSGTVATSSTTTEAGSGDGGGGDGGDHAPAGADLPAVTIPGEASPPTTAPGEEPNSIPAGLGGDEVPQFGTIVVDLDEGGYQDFAVHLRDDREVTLLSLADDGVHTEIEVFAPDGSSEGWWEGGEPGVVNGLEWYHPDEPLPATGTYVVRVIHTGGSHEPFVLGFFGNT